MGEARSGRVAVSGVIAALGALAIVGGSLLNWVTLTSKGIIIGTNFRVGANTPGIGSAYGTSALIAGCVGALAALWWMIRRRGRWIPAILVLLSGGASIGAAALFYAQHAQRAYLDWAVAEFATRQVPATEIRAALEGIFLANGVHARWGAGLVIVAVGGALAILVASMELLRRGPMPAAETLGAPRSAPGSRQAGSGRHRLGAASRTHST
jgi:hypothetical protein